MLSEGLSLSGLFPIREVDPHVDYWRINHLYPQMFRCVEFLIEAGGKSEPLWH